MSKYPVPIFQPTVPHDCQSNPLWLEQIHSWMSLQLERHEGFRRQLETQNHLLVQLNRRLDRVFLKLATIECDAAAFPQQTAGPICFGSPEKPCGNCLGDFGGCTAEGLVNPGESAAEGAFQPGMGTWKRPPSGVSSWMQQREVMLKCLVAQLEIEESLYPSEMPMHEPLGEEPLTGSTPIDPHPLTPRPLDAHPRTSQFNDSQVPPCDKPACDKPACDKPAGDSPGVDELKEQLQAAIREMEIECSVQRARLSHERARLEAREADLERREKKLALESREQLHADERAEPLVSRIKGILRRP